MGDAPWMRGFNRDTWNCHAGFELTAPQSWTVALPETLKVFKAARFTGWRSLID